VGNTLSLSMGNKYLRATKESSGIPSLKKKRKWKPPLRTWSFEEKPQFRVNGRGKGKKPLYHLV